MPERHQWSQAVAKHLHDVAVARAAQPLLDNPPGPGHLVVLPSWAWRLPKINVGRKSHSYGGKDQTLPIPITWVGGPVQVVADGALLRWSVTGLGVHERGTTHLTCEPEDNPDLDNPDQDDAGQDPAPAITAPALDDDQIRAQLTCLVHTGHQALWELREMFMGIVRHHLTQASQRIAAEITSLPPMGHAGTPTLATTMLDAEAIESLVTDLVLGKGADEGTAPTPTWCSRPAEPVSAVDRIINRLLTPSRLVAVDLNRYLNVAVRVVTETAVRRQIGDPHIGRKIRALAAQTSPETLDELVTEYRRTFPRDKLSTDRAVAALLVPQTAEVIRASHCSPPLDAAVESCAALPVLGIMVDPAFKVRPPAVAA